MLLTSISHTSTKYLNTEDDDDYESRSEASFREPLCDGQGSLSHTASILGAMESADNRGSSTPAPVRPKSPWGIYDPYLSMEVRNLTSLVVFQ